ncbi:4-O-methyl-glucuronoyl methylesterase 1 like protein [Verticillium longisporum]|uniref:4-O-methyl-glucuronoyl methylesterase 1 like protein n=1 Tax=Verticillium longisporum TaxID=100787 RepID=A0A8I3A0Z0_VERLO|nr:4-O-methyl-glucuronoyl methylesterase 1 like protein [Verticillium longisporum]
MKTLATALLFAASAAAQAGPWAQCGGQGHTGATTCVSGHYCSVINPWYSQCLPGTAPGGPPPPPPTTAVPPPPPVTTVSPPTTTPPTAPPPPVTPGTCPALPSGLGPANANLPNPFVFQNGAAVTTKADWACRQREISAQIQAYELGTLPGKPQSVTGSYSGNRLTINVSDQGRSISFAVTINKPSGTNVPAIIAYGAASIPIPAGVATITYNNDEVAQQQGGSSRGRGKFYDLYGSSHSAGALTAWAWGVARIIDALEATPAVGINAARVGVTGCSRNGKGAMVAGALEPRIALTLPQESGAGGSACWRIADWQKQNGQNVQTASQIVGENVWLGTAFNTYTSNVRALPFDHHMLAGLVAPRALYVMENSDMEWLGWTATYGCMGAARKQWEALGALDNFGYSQVGGNSHCSFPAAKQGSELTAFINKFLLQSGGGTTSIFRTEKNHGSFNLNTWASWSVPTLT